MSKQYRAIQISQLPKELVNKIRERIVRHSIVMLCYDSDESMVTPCSGTLCMIGDRYGIITAKHVWDNQNPNGDSGIKHHKKLIIPFGDRGAYTLETEWLSAIYPEIKGKKLNADIPDVAFVCIPSNFYTTFESYTKFFYSIDKSIHENGSELYDSTGVWFTAGCPLARLNAEVAEAPLATNLSELKEKYEEDQWDYVSLNVVVEEGKMPENVKGMSGGGMWRAKFSMREDLKEFRLHAVIFSGVNFFQTQFGREYQILGHGPMSIYKNLYNLVIGSE